MNTIRKSIIIGLTVLGLGSASLGALAHPQEGRHGKAATQELTQQQKQASWAERKAKRAERHAQRQAKLQQALKLTPAQEAAWASYTAAIKPAPHGEPGKRPDRASWAAMSAPQRMEQRIAMARQHTAMMEARLAALTSFYAVLTPEQKKVFDEQSQRRGGRYHGLRHKLHA